MKYAAVLFDMDGVVVDSEPLHMAAFKVTLDEYGYELSDAQYGEYFAGRTEEAGFLSFFEATGFWAELGEIVEKKASTYLSMMAGNLRPHEATVSCIRTLASSNTPLALVTSSPKSHVNIILGALDLTDSFSAIVTGDDVKNSKPHPEGYLKAATLLELEPTSCIVVEDAPNGIRAAKAAGAKCIALASTDQMEELSLADMIVSKLDVSQLDEL